VARIVFLGHATTLIEIDGTRLLTDPLLRRRIPGLIHRHPGVAVPPPESVDAVLISHLHHDHLDLPSLRSVRRDMPLLVPLRGAGLLRRRGFQNVVELQPNQTVNVGQLRVRATRADHVGFRAPFGPLGGCLGFVAGGAQRVYFAGDTDVFPEMAELGAIDVALVPVAGWGPRLGPGHMDPGAAVEALQLIRPRVAIPIHWGSLVPFGLHLRTWTYLTQPPLEFAELAAQRAPQIEVRVLQPGESYEWGS
jgi:L-ascorbate metabolism protein UlaG (beta-lactamase superfamily)